MKYYKLDENMNPVECKDLDEWIGWAFDIEKSRPSWYRRRYANLFDVAGDFIPGEPRLATRSYFCGITGEWITHSFTPFISEAVRSCSYMECLHTHADEFDKVITLAEEQGLISYA